MDFAIHNNNSNVRIVIRGQFTFTDNQKFKSILEIIDQEGLHSLDLDFSEVSFIDSAGLGMLLLLRDRCQNKHITISINSAHGQVEKVFLISKFDQLFSMPNKS